MPYGPTPGILRSSRRLDSICGKLVDHRGPLGEQCITIRDGVIEDFTEEPRGDTVVDLRGRDLLVTPALVDIHVHLRGLLLSYKEDEYSGTLKAARSGIGLVADMPNTLPRLDSVEALAWKLESLREKAVTDYMVYAAIPSDPVLVDKLGSNERVAGFKAYPRDYNLEVSLRRISSLGHLLVIHPELPVVEELRGFEDNHSRNTHRGCHWEAAAVDYIREVYDGRLHVTHASCASTVQEARRHGASVDVTPHHLLMHDRCGGCWYRVNPPLRPREEAQALLRLVLEGRVDAFASDHAPHTVAEKSEPLTCPPGIPQLPCWPGRLYRRLVASGALSVEEFLWLASRRPAKLIGRRDVGLLDHGAAAHLTVIDPVEGPGLLTIVWGRIVSRLEGEDLACRLPPGWPYADEPCEL